MPRFIMVGESRQSVNTPNVFAAVIIVVDLFELSIVS